MLQLYADLLTLTMRSRFAPSCLKPVRSEPGRFDTGRLRPLKFETSQFETSQFETSQFEKSQLETGRTGAGQAGTGQAEAERCQAGQVGTVRFDTVLVAVSEPATGRVGFGECAVNPMFGLTARDVVAELRRNAQPLASGADLQSMLDRTRFLSPAARSGAVGALLDLTGQSTSQPVWQRWSPTPDCPPSTITVSATTPDKLEQELDALASLQPSELRVVLSPLASHADHRLRLRLIASRFPDCRLTADLSASWHYEQFRAAIDYLDEYGVSRVEEPLSLDAPLTEYAALNGKIPFTLVADERLLQHSLDEIALYFGEVNLKAGYHGGILAVGSMMARAQSRGLRVCLGCHCESSVGITTIAHLGPLADHLDLGSALLLVDDPFSGVGWSGTRPVLGSEPGFGIRVAVPAKLSDELGHLLAS